MAQTNHLSVTRTIDAPVDQVWRALSDPEQIKAWWGPTGFTAPRVEGEFRVGGAMLVCMQGPGFPIMCNTWTYTEIVPGERISFDNRFADESGATIDASSLGLPPGIPAVVPHVLELKAADGGRTQLSWSEYGYTDPAILAQSRAGLDQVLDKLVSSLSGD